jgi:hypothetical protein
MWRLDTAFMGLSLLGRALVVSGALLGGAAGYLAGTFWIYLVDPDPGEGAMIVCFTAPLGGGLGAVLGAGAAWGLIALCHRLRGGSAS